MTECAGQTGGPGGKPVDTVGWILGHTYLVCWPTLKLMTDFDRDQAARASLALSEVHP